jgi:hypothetical protein
VNARLDAVEIFGVDPVFPRRDIRFDLFRSVTEEGLEVFVPPDGIGPEVPIPNGVECGAICKFKPLEAHLQRLLFLQLLYFRRIELESHLDRRVEDGTA